MSAPVTRGHCLCGAVSYAFTGTPKWSCYCHCDDCRRNCAAPVVAWFGVGVEQFTWTGETPKTYHSSPGVQRHFCRTCGTPIAFEAGHYPGDMELYAATLLDPSRFHPEFHVFHGEKLPYLELEDDLPKYPGSLLQSPDAPGLA